MIDRYDGRCGAMRRQNGAANKPPTATDARGDAAVVRSYSFLRFSAKWSFFSEATAGLFPASQPCPRAGHASALDKTGGFVQCPLIATTRSCAVHCTGVHRSCFCVIFFTGRSPLALGFQVEGAFWGRARVWGRAIEGCGRVATYTYTLAEKGHACNCPSPRERNGARALPRPRPPPAPAACATSTSAQLWRRARPWRLVVALARSIRHPLR